ncbi:2Fe-2S iron-sulfur cluster binding domain-containing protein [Mycobacterium sp. OAE908]|uniref:2Fe-2S iron-sulfur cluster-binding protein n=1 Tax=Mycobacterium sp. OAE908 TaxID=2817899 RepID=UPI001AE51C45
MATVRVQPSDISFDIAAGETIIEAAWRNDLWWPTICRGAGTCKTCVLRVVEGEEHLSPVEPWEHEGLDGIRRTLPGGGVGYRLACQVKAAGDVVVRKIGVRRTE